MSAPEIAALAARHALVVLSPHCDDAVLACGDLLAENPGALVVTVFAGGPASYGEPTDWDRRAGFAAGDDAMAARRAEDRRALATLAARPLWLPYRDRQYGPSPAVAEVSLALATVVAAVVPEVVAAPLGLFHSDHVLVHEAAIEVARASRGRAWLLYEDALYRRIPNLLAERVAGLRAAGLEVRMLHRRGRWASPAKRRAIACYASQIRALESDGRPGSGDAYEPEGYWLLHPSRNGAGCRPGRGPARRHDG